MKRRQIRDITPNNIELPLDAIILISDHLNTRSIIKFARINMYYYDTITLNLKDILKDIIRNKTQLTINDYNTNELIHLHKVLLNRNAISAGWQYSLTLINGKVYGFGINTDGQLGIGENSNRYYKLNPNKYLIKDQIAQLSSGTNASLLLKRNGHILSCGGNVCGELGRMNVALNFPLEIPDLNNIVQISSGYYYSLVLRKNDDIGVVYGFGYNRSGELGLKDFNHRYTPFKLPVVDNIVQVSSGGYHSLILSKSGNVYAFGHNHRGQLGLSHNISNNEPTLITTVSDIVQISTGLYHSLLLKNDGKVYSFGENKYGQLGIGTFKNTNIPTVISDIDNILQVGAGGSHSLILNNQGKVYAFGNNNHGQLGLDDYKNRNIPICILTIKNIISISAGYNHSLLLRYSDRVYACGDNRSNQLGFQNHPKQPHNYYCTPILIH